MRYLVTGKQMKEIDKDTIERIGIPSLVLMERAALAVTEELLNVIHINDRIWIACGCGNNGADGIAVGRMLYLKGYRVEIILAGDEEKAAREMKVQLGIAKELEIPVFSFCNFIPGRCDVLVDAVFGVGLDRVISGEYSELLELLREKSPGFVAAVDIPSGIHSDTGAVMGIAVKADMTITFGYEKLGTALYPGRAYAGTVIVKDIGFPPISLRRTGWEAFTYEPEDLIRIPERERYSNKGSFGKLLIAAGSNGMAGAAYLSALAAYKTGAGLVKIITPPENSQILQQLLPEAILAVCDRDLMSSPEDFAAFVSKQCQWASAIIVGSGLGMDEYAHVLTKHILECAYVPIVIDADALNLAAKHPELTKYFTENIIITPHLGEFARLTGKSIKEIQSDLPGTAKEYGSRYGITCIAKDAATVVALRNGKFYINNSGNSAMAKAGSGDVLTGIIGGLLALGLEEEESACLGVFLHGLAGDRAKEHLGEHGVLARNLTEYIPRRDNRMDAEAGRR